MCGKCGIGREISAAIGTKRDRHIAHEVAGGAMFGNLAAHLVNELFNGWHQRR